MLRFLLQMEGSTIRNELTDYFHDSPDCPSPSAFYQQRLKIKPDALYMLFRTFTAQYKGTRWKGYRLLAVDGSTIYTPRNEKDASSYLFNGAGKKGWNCVHMNALYDLMDGLYVDAAVHPGKKPGEQAALKPMLDRLSAPGHSIIIGDRGYESFQMVADLEARGIPFVIRVKKPSSNWGFLAKADFPEQKEFDLPFTCKIAHANSFKGNKSRARMLGEGYRPGNRCFSYVSKDSPPPAHGGGQMRQRPAGGGTGIPPYEPAGRTLWLIGNQRAVQAALGDRDFFPGIKICPFAAPFPFKKDGPYDAGDLCKAYHVQLQPHDYQSVEA